MGVVPFPGQPLVAVLCEPDCFSVMLAKIGAKTAVRQVSFTTLDAAEQSARDGAEMLGCRYVGVIDERFLQRLDELAERAARDEASGPGAA